MCKLDSHFWLLKTRHTVKHKYRNKPTLVKACNKIKYNSPAGRVYSTAGLSLCNCNADTAGGFDLIFGRAREKPGLDNDGLSGKFALAEHFEVTTLGHVDDGRGGSVLGRRLPVLFGHQRPDLVQVDRA